MRKVGLSRRKENRKTAARRRLFEVLESRRLLAADSLPAWVNNPDHWHQGWEMTHAEFVQQSPEGPMVEGAYQDYLNGMHGDGCGGGEGDEPPHEPGCSCGQCAPSGPTLFVERPEGTPELNVTGGDSSGSSAPAALADTFLLHSLPNADHTIYLDFDGHVTEGTTWNSQSGRSSIVSPAYDPGGNGASFTNSELTQIQDIWKRVAEDFSPFAVNVTTEDPGAAALSKTGGSDTQWGSRVVITTDWDNCGCGGFAYLTSFNDSVDEPVFVFNTSAIGVSAATTHEVGHALGLSHDGTTQNVAYYGGHGSGEVAWGPIMGSGYSTNMTTWDTGQYYQANNNEDDWQIITTDNGFGYRADDHGGSAGTASQLQNLGTNPTDSQLVDVSGFGVISQAADQDWFEFETGEGAINLTIDSYVQETYISNGVGYSRTVESTPSADQGSNLDVLATIYDSNQTVVATSNPATALNASFSDLNLTAGTYYLAIDGIGYGNWAASSPTGFDESVSRGQYLITGSVVLGSQTLNAGNDSASTLIDTPVDINVLENDSDPQNGTFSITALTNPSNGQVSQSNGIVTYTPNNGYSGIDSFTYTITDDQNETATATVTVTVAPPAPEILFVDDDQGASYERFYTAALDANSLSYDNWQVSSSGLPTTSDLSPYSLVIWNTGFDYSAGDAGLSTAEQTALSGFLDGGGGLFLVGQDILYNGLSASFQTDYLKIGSFTSDVRNLSQFAGVSGNAISDGMNLSFNLPADFSADWSDSLSPAAGAEGVFYRNSVNTDAQPFNTISYGGSDFRVVFMAAPFEGISNSAGDPNNQAFVMDRVINFLMPPPVATGDVIVTPATPSGVTSESGGEVSFTVVLTEAPTSNVTFSVSSSDTTEGTSNVSELVFTPSNWNSAQTVIVTGVDDAVVDGDISYSIVLGSAVSADSNYSGLDPADVAITNTDNDLAGLTLDLGQASVSEGSTLLVTVFRNTETSSPLTVNLASSDTTEATVPQTVTIPAGQSSVDFNITGVNDGFVDGNQTATITATVTNYQSGSGNVEVVDVDQPTLTLNLDANEVIEGGTITASVIRNTETSSPLTVNLISSDITEATVPETVTIPAGSASVSFTITGVDDLLVDGDQTSIISAENSLYIGSDATVTVTDNEVASLTVSIASTTLDEGSVTTGTVTRNTVTTNALTVNLASSDTTEATVPQTVTIPAGQSSVDFNITGVNDGFVDGDQTATITATVTDYQPGSEQIVISNTDVNTLGVAISDTSITEAGGVATATVTRNTSTNSSLVVNLESSETTAAVVPVSVTIPAGQSSVTFDVTGVDDLLVDGDQTTLITASVDNYVDGSQSIVVTDNDVATLTMSIEDASISEAGGLTTATLSRNTLTTDAIVVALNSNDITEASVPSSITIPAGDPSVTFEIQAVDDSIFDGNQVVEITAVLPGFVSAVGSLQINDDEVAPPAPEILFVDDDQGASYERFYTAALDANSLSYDNWQVSSSGLPTTSDLSPYSLVIWNTGFDYSAGDAGLSTAEQTALSGFLDGGGGLFLVGQDILYNGLSASFQTDYLKIGSFTSDVRNLSQFAGVSGNAISDGMNLSFNLPADFSADWSDSLSPAAGAEGVFYRNSVNTDAQPFNTISYGGSDFRVVFMAAPFEGISNSAGDPNNQAFVMDRVINFLMPPPVATGDVIVTPATPSGVTSESGGEVSFTVVLTEAPTSNVTFSVSSSDTTEGTSNVSELVFTPSNWNSAQTVIVTGVDDAVVDGDISYSIVLGSAVSADSNYSGLDPADVAITNTDNDLAGLTLDLGQASVSEGSTLLVTVFRNTETSSPLTVNLASSDTTEATVPQTVTIPAGQSSVDFNITGVNDGFVDGNQTATITATVTNYQSGSGNVEVVDVDQPTLTLNLDANEVIEGGTITASVIRNTETSSPLTVNLISSDITEATVPETVTIPAGSASVSFTITGVDDLLVDGDQTSIISAENSLYIGSDATVTVTDNEVASLTVSIASTTLDEGSVTTGTVTRNTVTTNALTVNLASSDTTEATVPQTVTIPAGQSSVDFNITGVNDGFVDGDQTATITATVTDYQPGSGNVEVVDVDQPTLTLNLDANEVIEGGTITASVIRNTETSSPLTVNLISSDITEATVPETVTIPAGSASVSFTVFGVSDGVVDGTQAVTLEASSGTMVAGADVIDVLDTDSEQTDVFYFSRKNNGSVSGLVFQNEDIVGFDGSEFRVVFDGTPWVSELTLDAFRIQSTGSILMSFSQAGSITGTSLSFDDSDILQFSPTTQTWEIFFDGSDVGLTSNGEDVDGISFAPDGRLIVSTTGSSSTSGLNARDEDLIVFNALSLGSNTSGTFEMYFDGSDVGLSSSSSEDVDAVSVTSDGTIYLSTTGNFSVSGISGADEDVFVFNPASLGPGTAGSFDSSLFFDGSTVGFGNDVGGLQVVDPSSNADLPLIPLTPVTDLSGFGGSEIVGDALMLVNNEGSLSTESNGWSTMQTQWQILAGAEGEYIEAVQQGDEETTNSDAPSSVDDSLSCLDQVLADWIS